MKSIFYTSLLLLFISCGSKSERNGVTQKTDNALSITDFMDEMVVDGFDYPIGNIDGKGSYTSLSDGKKYDSWRISATFAENYDLGIHTGIDFNGTGGGNTDLGQPVSSIAKGLVVDAKNYGAPWGGVVVLKHKYMENGQLLTCLSLYAHLENLTVKKGEVVHKRHKLGTIGTGEGSYPAHLHLEIRKPEMMEYPSTYWPSSNDKDVKWVKKFYHDPAVFISKHRKLVSPSTSKKMIIAIKSRYKMYLIENGAIKKEYEISLSQNPNGHKEKQGDLKLPEGEYYITEKRLGPFSGDYSEYLGSRYLRISYPNCFDAEQGLKKGLLTKKEKEAIITANNQKKAPPKNTKVGGGILIHGWNEEWKNDGERNLTWGCICMHNYDLDAFFENVELNTVIVISK